MINLERTDRLHLSPTSRISVKAEVDPTIRSAVHLGADDERPLANRISDACVRALRNAKQATSIFASPGKIADDGVNIIVNLTVGPNAQGRPYRIALVAKQGSAVWASSVERADYRFVPGNIPIAPNHTTPDGKPYWDPGLDTNALGERFCTHLLSGDL